MFYEKDRQSTLSNFVRVHTLRELKLTPLTEDLATLISCVDIDQLM